MKYERFLNYFVILTLFLCYAKCNNTDLEDVDDFQQTSMMLENAEMRIKTALKSVLKRSLPYLMRIFEEVNVSSPCTKSSVLFLKDLMKLKEWPLRMIDSFGKLPAGMLGMTQWMSGDYDQCLDIEIPQDKKQITDKEKEQIRGKYCALTIGMQESLKHIAKSIHKLENNSLIKLAKEIIVMIDSFGKLPAGMLGITLWISGDYDQCLDIKIPQNKKKITDKAKEQVGGKYCALTIGMQESLKPVAKSFHKLENNSLIKLVKEIIKPMKLEDLFKINVAKMVMGIRLDVCIPSTCSNKDLKHVGNWIFGTAVDFNVGYCKIKDERIEYSTGQLISLIVLGIFIAWVGLATLTEILMRLHIIPLKASKGKCFEYVLGASPYKSLHKLYYTNLDESTNSMCGVKFLLVNIVVLGHVCVAGSFYPTVGGIVMFLI
ncbi:uncharacterized protein LOC111614272 [Centruroides sculpturatus]|uniref:uncharacterized protein LOC111614272 n=1 Tax=Centruroides sculpturatus TaxID=218467 RepID=UPI000C6D7C64|nr:uncharacterized protein LOC111614272 [Centruroides sculpturatus]